MHGALIRLRRFVGPFTVLVAAIATAAGLLVAVPVAAAAKPAPTASVPAALKSKAGSKVASTQSRAAKPINRSTVTGFHGKTSTLAAQTATSNDYLNADGTHTLQVSDSTINYQDPKGAWHSVDNRVVADPDRTGGLTNVANGWRVHFGTSGQGVALDTSAGSVSIVPVGGAAGVKPAVAASGQGVVYTDVWPGADVTYNVTGDSVKETVLIKSAAAGSTFTFRSRSGAKAQVLGGGGNDAALAPSDGGLKPTGALGSQVQFDQPVVVDALGTPITDAGAKLTTKGNGTVILSLDPAWLAAQPASAFPIRLDPSVNVGSNTQRAYKIDGYSCTNCGVQVGNPSQAGYINDYWSSRAQYQIPNLAGSTVLSAQVGFTLIGGRANQNPTYINAQNADNYWGAYGTGAVASGQPGASGWIVGQGLPALVQTYASAGQNAVTLGFSGWNTGDNSYTWQNFATSLAVTYDHAPTATLQTNAYPGDKGVVASSTPTLSVPAAGDSDGDQVFYNFTISGAGDTAGKASSGWQTSPSFQVPAGVLADGQSYTWSVQTSDGPATTTGPWTVTPAAWSNTISINHRLGASQVTPTDAVGPVTVNLANGNANIAIAARTVKTVSGDLGVGFSYNSQAQVASGLTGQYYADADGKNDFSSAGTPLLVRTDPQLNFSWGHGGAEPASALGVPATQFLVKWTGYITAPVTGSYQLGATMDDGTIIKVNNTAVYSNWPGGGVWSSPQWGTAVTLTAGMPVPIEVQYNNQFGPGFVGLWVQGAGTGAQIVPTNWLSTGLTSLPAGWTLSLPGGSATYTNAAITPTGVTLTDGEGATHSYAATSGGGYTPPPGEDGVLTAIAGGGVLLKDSDGSTYSFDSNGLPVASTSASDSLHPAAAAYTYNSSVPPQAVTVNDPVSKSGDDPVQGKVVEHLYYGNDSHCGTPPATYDTSVPSQYLCGVRYWDDGFADTDSRAVATTHLYYQNDQLAALVEPGNEVTQFGYNGALLANVATPTDVDWQQAVTGRTMPTTDIAYTFVAAASGAATQNVRPSYVPLTCTSCPPGSVPMVTSVTAPSPVGGAADRPVHSYTYNGATDNATQVTIKGISPTARAVTYDQSGRTKTDTTATGQTTMSTWDGGGQDLPIATTDAAGRVTATVYDWALRATDTYGPAPSGCLGTDGFPVAQLPASCGVIPHTHTGYDTDPSGHRIQGLETSTWANIVQSGPPATRSTTSPSS